MSGPIKRREIQEEIEDDEDHSTEESDEEDEEEVEQGMEIQVEFEGRNPQDPDFHRIKNFLQQLFLKAHLDLGGLADLIISQNYVGSVVTQADDDDENSDDEESTGQEVFGITTVLNISERQNVPCIKQLRDLLRDHAEEHATDATNTMIKSVLENDSAPLGLLINERFINIPAQISVPLLENLLSEVKRAAQKKMPFDFSYYILICKLKKAKEENRKKGKDKRNNDEEYDVIWSNPEEEIFAEDAVCSFEFSVETESDNGLTGTWTEDDDELVSYRRVLLFEASKLPEIIRKVKSKIG
ncbi:protein BCCIP homolog [Copidosoma floridanum]|uniref:protein BCCIP homolog n=1 Tax=Copidosoma floridanum TaxID=29053 RepID=UPI0006C97BF9|nr:protein BCCIP homolog [Copidosoma floridanum]XP_014203370.1 protein BCCIP homolog [Copidosoma floridanum]